MLLGRAVWYSSDTLGQTPTSRPRRACALTLSWRLPSARCSSRRRCRSSSRVASSSLRPLSRPRRSSGAPICNDPRVTMELGPGIEAGGVFASAATPDALCLNFQVQGGNAWAECNAFAAKTGDGLELVDLEIRMMDGALSVDLRPRDAEGGRSRAAAVADERGVDVGGGGGGGARRGSLGASGAAARGLILSRRTINDFEPKLPENGRRLIRAVEAATFAPNRKRTEPWRPPARAGGGAACAAQRRARRREQGRGRRRQARALSRMQLARRPVRQRRRRVARRPGGRRARGCAACCCIQNLCLSLHMRRLRASGRRAPSTSTRFGAAASCPPTSTWWARCSLAAPRRRAARQAAEVAVLSTGEGLACTIFNFYSSVPPHLMVVRYIGLGTSMSPQKSVTSRPPPPNRLRDGGADWVPPVIWPVASSNSHR